MIYLELLWEFMKVGMLAFGGAYGAIPLIRDAALSNDWLSEEMFTYFLAVSESTPGPIMINMATYIGSSQAGLLGAAAATIGVVLPAFIIISVVVFFFSNLFSNKYVQAVLSGIKPCFIGIVLAMGMYMVVDNVFLVAEIKPLEWQAFLMTGVLLALTFLWQRFKKKDFPPILLIVLAAGMGIVVYVLP